MQNNENRLVPGQGRPIDLGKLKHLAYGNPPAAGRSTAPFRIAIPSPRPRRFRRAASDWSGLLGVGLLLAAVAFLVHLDQGKALRNLIRGTAAPVLPDAALNPEDREKYWALAGHDPARFARLLGVDPNDPARMEQDARKLERLLAERSLLQ